MKTLQALTLSSGVRSAAQRTPDKTALICDSREFCYSELINRINRVSEIAIEKALKRSDHAAILAPNCPEYIEIVTGLSDAGIAVVTINYRLDRAEVTRIINDSGAKLVFVHPDCVALIALEDCPLLQDVLVLDEHYQKSVERQSSGGLMVADDEYAVFSIPYTSGTTGNPKGVMISHRSRTLSFYAMAVEYGCFSSESFFLAVTPLCHGAGFAFAYAPLFFGGTVELLTRFDAEKVLKKLHGRQHDGVFFVPTHFDAFFSLSRETLLHYKGHALTSIISNASALPQAMKHEIVSYFGDGVLHETYGSTEAGIVANLKPEYQLIKKNCVGLPFQGNNIQLRDEQGNVVPCGEPGELFSRNMTGFSGYWNNATESNEAIDEQGWVSVGDIARCDEDGFIYIIDRKKDLIISGGINIYPKQIEQVIEELDWVREVAVVGVTDAKWGQIIKAVVVKKQLTDKHTGADVIDHCETALARFKVPRLVAFIDQLPRNANGKVLRRNLRVDFTAHSTGNSI